MDVVHSLEIGFDFGFDMSESNFCFSTSASELLYHGLEELVVEGLLHVVQ